MCCYCISNSNVRGRLLDFNICRGDGGGMSDRFLVEAGLKVVGGLRSTRRVEGWSVAVSELNKSEKERP